MSESDCLSVRLSQAGTSHFSPDEENVAKGSRLRCQQSRRSRRQQSSLLYYKVHHAVTL